MRVDKDCCMAFESEWTKVRVQRFQGGYFVEYQKSGTRLYRIHGRYSSLREAANAAMHFINQRYHFWDHQMALLRRKT
ncbi:MAG: hypothetical protein E6R04_07255 [Spirochaetes bacterium]|nr:MAG: hypothetical protein E6R04_07255 [Spirochaetota bacterium]